jgi:hypothetical protein
VNIDEKKYHESLISTNKPLLEFISNSRSGVDFFMTPDLKYMIKTNKPSEMKFLQQILG